MNRKKLILLTIVLLVGISSANAWKPWPLPMDSIDCNRDSLYYNFGSSALASTGHFAPFWFQSNRYGEISAMPFSGNIKVAIEKPMTRPNRWYDYDFSLDLAGRVDTKKTTAWFNRLYAHIRLYIFDLTVGIKPINYGNQDYELCSGGLLLSNNTHPLPRITIGIDQYTPFPFTYGYMEIKGGITHAWVIDNAYVSNYFIHHKFAAIRIGGQFPVNISYEFHHAAQWGGISPTLGNLGSSFYDFMNVFFARSGGNNNNDLINAEGNHIGMQCLSLDIKNSILNVSVYWQNIFEDGPVRFIGNNNLNLRDGLWGISLNVNNWNYIQSVCYEFLNTTDQSGPMHDRDGFIYGGNDSYYINAIYPNGWNYFYRSLGTPFITSPIYNNDDTPYTKNNRVRVHHIGIKGNIYGYKYRFLASHAQNYGRYGIGSDNEIKSRNTALLLEIEKYVEHAWGLSFGLSFAVDMGNQFGNQFGTMITISKKGLITKW